MGAVTDPDIAATAALIGEPSRAAILVALWDGRALPAGELARVARISPQTASAHLDKLSKGNLVTAEVQGRHRYYRLHDAHVADLLEACAVVAPPAPALTAAQHGDAHTLRFARTCYGHLAGTLGVAVAQALRAKALLRVEDGNYAVTDQGAAWFHDLGIEITMLRRQPLTRSCLDWSERRHHLAGALGVALTSRMLDRQWLVRVRNSRALRLTDQGTTALRAELGLEL